MEWGLCKIWLIGLEVIVLLEQIIRKDINYEQFRQYNAE